MIPFVLLSLALVGCGSSGSSDSSGDDKETETETETETVVEGQCTITNDTITVENNSSCTLSDSDAGTYFISSGGEVMCNNGTMVFGGLSAGSGTINYNGLALICGS